MRVALYARISSEKGEKFSILGQLNALRDYAEERNWTVYDEFVDKAISGYSDIRPGFQKMIGLALSGENLFSAIIVWKFSRFTFLT